MVGLTHLDAVKQMRDPVEDLLGWVLHLPEHPACVPDQGTGQPGGHLPHVGDHGGPLHLVLSPHIGQSGHQLVQGVTGAAEGEREKQQCDKTRPQHVKNKTECQSGVDRSHKQD